jgi:hypothetical protein
MTIDPSAVGASGGPVERSWTSAECLLYALGVGAGTDELRFSTEKNQQVLPTMAVVLGPRGTVPMGKVGTFNPAMLVHGEQRIELARALPPEGRLKATGRIAAIYDKGKGAVIVTSCCTRRAPRRSSAARAASAAIAVRRGRRTSRRAASPITRSAIVRARTRR